MVYRAYAAKQAKSQLEPFEYSPGELAPEEVEIAVSHCGICHTDVAMVDNDWGATQFPFVPGHEIAGRVSALGASVNPERLRVGQRVAMGAICGSCQSCELCESGKQNVCAKRVDTVMRGHQGGFASHVRAANWRFVYPLPDEIASEHAGPLLCAGTTVFTPLLRHNVRPIDRVAVVGIGGLGHLALQYLAKWGCDVTAITSSHDKDEQARELGARHVIASRVGDELAKAAGSFDFILSTVSGDLPYDQYLAALRPQGKLCLVGVPDKPVTFSGFSLMTSERMLASGVPGSPVETQRMLDFTARHGIAPKVEVFPMAEANRALEHTRKGRARFRAVLAT
jgi:alcohol/geraniol dehydrogenase (NADP+)